MSEYNSDDEIEQFDEKLEEAATLTNTWLWQAHQLCRNIKEVRNDRSFTGRQLIVDILQGHPQRCHDHFRMYTDAFMKLCREVEEQGIINVREVSVEEQVGMFLQTVGHSDPMRKVGEDFQYSTETVWRCINRVLHSVRRLQGRYMVLPDSSAPIHPLVADTPFKNALGAIDGTHIHAFPDPKDGNKERYRNRKGFMSQNVMGVVDFDGKFLGVIAGWEGSAHDNYILREALDDDFVVPPNRYYLVDGGYANTPQFISPYRGRPYHIDTFKKYLRNHGVYASPEDKFNHRHAQLRNIVEKTFGILKNRFKILQLMHKYKFKVQAKMVIACCVLHNFIKDFNTVHNISDEVQFDENVDNDIFEGDSTILPGTGSNDSNTGDTLRDEIRDELWNSS